MDSIPIADLLLPVGTGLGLRLHRRALGSLEEAPSAPLRPAALATPYDLVALDPIPATLSMLFLWRPASGILGASWPAGVPSSGHQTYGGEVGRLPKFGLGTFS